MLLEGIRTQPGDFKWSPLASLQKAGRVRDGNNADSTIKFKKGPRQIKEDVGRGTWPWHRGNVEKAKSKDPDRNTWVVMI